MKRKWTSAAAIMLVCTMLPLNVYAAVLPPQSDGQVQMSAELASEVMQDEQMSTESELIEIDSTEELEVEELESEESESDEPVSTEVDLDERIEIDPSKLDYSLVNAAASERADITGDAAMPSFLREQGDVAATGVISPTQKLVPSTAAVADVVELVRPVIYTNELGSNWQTRYGYVTTNDNGNGISVGILQWNATNALMLLKVIVARDTEAESILGTGLYDKIRTDISWSGADDTKRFVPSLVEAAAIGQLLQRDVGKSVQDDTAESYIYDYMTTGYTTYGIRNAAALAYFCDIRNQCGNNTVARIAAAAKALAGGTASAITLNEIHAAAVLDTVAGNYLSRRYLTYDSVADAAENKGWSYHGANSYRIPSETVTSVSKKSEIQWLQWALNLANAAGLEIDGGYGPKTTAAVTSFQAKYAAEYNLTADGWAGRQTITALLSILNEKHYLDIDFVDLSSIKPMVSAIANTTTGVKLTWKAVDNATGYYIYRKLSGGGYKKIATIQSQTTVTYTDTTAVNNKVYDYTVKAYNSASVSGCNKPGKTIRYMNAPVLKTAVLNTTGIKLTWNKVSGVTGYYVYRKVSGGSYKKIATIQSASKVTYTDKSLTAGKKYTYAVRAYKGSYYSAYRTGISQTYQKLIKYKTTSRLNYRSNAGTKYASMGVLNKGKVVYVVKGSSKKANGYTWVKVRIDGKYYYAALKYMKKV